jgi:hypothetical protein
MLLIRRVGWDSVFFWVEMDGSECAGKTVETALDRAVEHVVANPDAKAA